MIHCEEQMNERFPGISCDSEQAPGWRQQRWALCAGSRRWGETAVGTVEKLHFKTRPYDAWLVVWPISRSWNSIYLTNNLRRRCRTGKQVAESEAKLLCGKILGNKAGQCGNILPACHSQESDKTRYGLLVQIVDKGALLTCSEHR